MISERHGVFHCFGKEFSFVPSDKAARREAYRNAQLHTSTVIAEREQAAGRQLTTRELYDGIQHPETRPILQQIRDSGETRTNESPPDKSDWAQRRISELSANPGFTPEDRARTDRRLEQLADTVARQKRADDGKKAEEARAADPKIQRALAHARSVCEGLAFDPNATAADVESAKQRLALANDPKAYWVAWWPIAKARDEKVQAAADELNARAKTLALTADQIQERKQIPPEVLAELEKKE